MAAEELRMSDEEALLRAVVERPAEATDTWLVLADWLEEHGRGPHAELIRLQHQPSWRTELAPEHRRVQAARLIAAGVRPCVPSWRNAVGMTFAWCPPGTFIIGSPHREADRDADEEPHSVTLTRGFWLGQYPVTQAQWRAVTGADPSRFKGDDRPVEHVSWRECVDFCQRLGERDGRAYRLPTEAEWEYACRAGTTTPFFWGVSFSLDWANEGQGISGQYAGETTPVGSFPPNFWGLYDMHGNVCEWCQDVYARFEAEPAVDPTGPTVGGMRVLRGGSWCDHPRGIRAAYRCPRPEDHVSGYAGVRLCVSG
jgi:uncharacterized protein (TIGR02996 family)